MKRRSYGNTGVKLSVIGFGGIVLSGKSAADAERIVGKSIERGINYFDVAPGYGNAEEVMGVALEPYREDVFLACKVHDWTAQGSRTLLTESLRRLRTDHLNLYQLHQVSTVDQVEQVFGPGGAMETLEAALEEGLCQYVGFSAHTEEAALALLGRYQFNSVMFPINYASYLVNGFGVKVISAAQKLQTPIMALKALAKGKKTEHSERWYDVITDSHLADLALRFTLGLPVVSALTPGVEESIWTSCDISRNLRALEEEELGELRRAAALVNPLFSPDE